LSGDVVSIAEGDGRSVDVVVDAIGDPQLDAVVGEWFDVEIAVSGKNVITSETRPLRSSGCALQAVGETVALLPFKIDKFVLDVFWAG